MGASFFSLAHSLLPRIPNPSLARNPLDSLLHCIMEHLWSSPCMACCLTPEPHSQVWSLAPLLGLYRLSYVAQRTQTVIHRLTTALSWLQAGSCNYYILCQEPGAIQQPVPSPWTSSTWTVSVVFPVYLSKSVFMTQQPLAKCQQMKAFISFIKY